LWGWNVVETKPEFRQNRLNRGDPKLTLYIRHPVNVIKTAKALKIPSVVVIKRISVDQDQAIPKDPLNVPGMQVGEFGMRSDVYPGLVRPRQAFDALRVWLEVWWEAIYKIGLDTSLNFPEGFGVIPYLEKLRLKMMEETDFPTNRSNISRWDNLHRNVVIWFGPSFDSRSPSGNVGVERRVVLSREITME